MHGQVQADPPVVILCGGLGLRQRSDGDDMPKSLRLLPDGRPLLLHVLDYYGSFGMREFILCVGYRASAIEALLLEEFAVARDAVEAGPGWCRFESAGTRITLVDSGVEAGKARRLHDAGIHVGRRPFLVGYADVLSNVDLRVLIERHRAAGGLLTLVATRVRSRFGELAVDEAFTVTCFVEKPARAELISAGYFMCAPEVLDSLTLDLELEAEILPRLVARRSVHAMVHDGVWLPFDTYKDFMEAEALVEKEGYPWLQPT